MSQVTAAEIARISLFEGLPAEDLAALAGVASRRRLGDGEALFEQGAPARSLHVVVEGGLVLRTEAGGRSIIVESLRPGDLVGWSAMREGAVTLSMALATGPTEVIAIPIDTVIELAAGGSRESARLVRRIVGLAARHLEASWNQLLQSGNEGVISGG
ncbi:MAG: cyclic nucleotide-binding domain-containing protein [Chloroflexota bacterium]|nr:cyclic nucleotide-binding domain-containing protein [Chloroflexota bacterium]